MRSKYFVYSMLFLIFSGCAGEWQNPNTTTPAKKMDITTILINPIIYDSAGVIVEGRVWDLVFSTLGEDDKDKGSPYTNFKLADKDGNFVNVFALGHLPIAEGDIVEVIGIYRRALNISNYRFINEIEAKRVKKKL
ncbi:MAG: hypothetical protein C4291_12580 [Candidatus Dadabacteria bacterium]